MLGDSVLTALEKMKQTDQQQHSDGLLQEFCTMTQKHNEPIIMLCGETRYGRALVKFNFNPRKLWEVPLKSGEDCWLTASFEACILSCEPKWPIWSKARLYTRDQLIKFAVEKEAEINFDKAKKVRDLNSKPKATTHFLLNTKKSTLPTSPAVRMVSPAPEEKSGEGETTPLPSKESNSTESYGAMQEDATVSQGDIEITVRVAQASKAFTG